MALSGDSEWRCWIPQSAYPVSVHQTVFGSPRRAMVQFFFCSLFVFALVWLNSRGNCGSTVYYGFTWRYRMGLEIVQGSRYYCFFLRCNQSIVSLLKSEAYASL